MITTSYILTSVIASLGLLAGIILIFIAKEEQKPGKKYFIITKNILFLLIIFFVLFYLIINKFTSQLLIISTLIISYFIALSNKKIKKLKKDLTITYTLLAIIFCLSSKNTNLFITEASLIFLYGIPAASLLADTKKIIKNTNILLNSLIFIIIAILPFLFS